MDFNKELIKKLIGVLQDLQRGLMRHSLKMHFISLYISCLSCIEITLTMIKKPEKSSSLDPKILQNIEKSLNSAENLIKKLENTSFFSKFGQYHENREVIRQLFLNYNENLDFLKKLGVSIDKCLVFNEDGLDSKLFFIDEEIKKINVLTENYENSLKFNTSLRYLQSDLSYILFVRFLKESGNSIKKLIKQFEFLQLFTKFTKDFEGFELKDEQIQMVQKRLRVYELLGSFSASKLSDFFEKIWGNINERNRILEYKGVINEKEEEIFIKEFNKSIEFENKNMVFLDLHSDDKEEEKEIEIDKIEKKGDCAMF